MRIYHQPNWGFNADTNSGHAFGIFMPAIGTLQPIGFRCRLTVKSRLVINALLEQFRFFGVPVFQGLNR